MVLDAFRARLGSIIGGFDAAQSHRRMRGFRATRAHVNTLIAASGETITARARWLARNNGYAANAVDVGFGGTVAAVAARLPRRLGPARYRVGIVAAWGAFRRVAMRVRHDGGEHEGRLCNVVVANGQFFGGGLKVAPRALPDDGRLDVQAWGGTPTDVVRAARLLRDGSHLQRPDVRAWSSGSVTIETETPVRVEADGEPLGRTPVTCTALRGAVRLKV